MSAQVLSYHVVPGLAVLSYDIPAYQSDIQYGGLNLTTSANAVLAVYVVDNVPVAVGPEWQIAYVTKANIQAGAAVIHIIDRSVCPRPRLCTVPQAL